MQPDPTPPLDQLLREIEHFVERASYSFEMQDKANDAVLKLVKALRRAEKFAKWIQLDPVLKKEADTHLAELSSILSSPAE